MAFNTAGVSFGDVTTDPYGRVSVGVKTPQGIDMQKLQDAQRQAASLGIKRTQDRIDLNTKKLAAYDQIIEKKNTLQASVDQIRGPNRFDNVTNIFDKKGVGSTTTTVAQGSITDPFTATQGAFDLTVVQVAKTDTQKTSTFGSLAALVGQAGTLRLNGQDFTLTASTTYDDLQKAINAVKDTTRVSAKCIELSTGVWEMRLEGLDQGQKIAFTTGSTAEVLTTLGLSTETVEDTLKCKLYRNNVTTSTIVRDTNTITDLEPGITLYAESVGTTRIEIYRDASVISTTLYTFMESYNDLIGTLNELTHLEIDGDGDQVSEDKSGILSSSSAAHMLLASCKEAVTRMVGGTTVNTIQILSDMGITWKTGDGRLEITAPDKFNNAVNNQADALRKFFEFCPKSTNTNFEFLGGPKTLPTALVGKDVAVTLTNTAGVYTATFNDGTGAVAATLDQANPHIIRGTAGTNYANFTIMVAGTLPTAGQSTSTTLLSVTQGIGSALNVALNEFFYEKSDTDMGLFQWERATLIKDSDTQQQEVARMESMVTIKMDALQKRHDLLMERMSRSQAITRQLEAMYYEMMANAA